MTSSDLRLFGLRLRSLREIAGVTQVTLAEKCLSGKGQDFVSKVEKGKLLLTEIQIDSILKFLSNSNPKKGTGGPITAAANPLNLTFWDPSPGKDAPRILKRAAAAYNCALQMEEIVGDDRVFRAAQKDSYFLFEPKYLPEFDDGLDSLKFQVRDHLASLLPDTQIKVEPGSFQPEYDAIRWTALVANSRIVYPFPFILTPRRIHNWFVVPYARHRRIGIAMHEGNPNLARWERLTEEEKNPTAKSYKGAEWIERLLKDVTIEKARVFGMDGWIQQELTPQLFRHFAPEIARYLPEYAVPLLSRDLIWESNRIKVPLPSQLRSDSMSRHDIYIFDLADQETIHRVAREDPKFGHLRTLQFSHGFDLPVGVGFSITMVPTILPKTPNKNRSGRGETVVFPWKSLLQNLEGTVFSEDSTFEGGKSYRAKFEEIGIEMGYKEDNNQDQK